MLTETIARGWENLLGRNSHATMLLSTDITWLAQFECGS